MKAFRTIPYLGSVALAMATAGELRPIATTRSEHAISASTRAGEIVLTARELQLDVKSPTGQDGKGTILIVFDRSSGRFLWNLGLGLVSRDLGSWEYHLSKSKIYVTTDRMVMFTLTGSILRARSSTLKADSLDDAEVRGLRDATSRLADFESGKRGAVEMNLAGLPNDFFAPPLSSTYGPINLVGVSRADDTWEITVKGQWLAKLTVNDKFEVTKRERIE